MKNSLFVILLISTALVSSLSAQMVQSPEVAQREAERRMAERTEAIRKEQEFNRLKVVSQFPNIAATTPKSSTRVFPVTITKEQKKQRVPSAEDSAKYSAFLRLPNTGLIKIFPDLGCFSQNVINIEGSCENAIPFSSNYSFRKTDYTNTVIADLGLKDEMFFTEALLSNGMIVKLGDIPIESVSLNSDGVKFLADYQPAKEGEEFLIKSKQLAEGVKNGEFIYAKNSAVADNTTYAMRVIAYNGEMNISFTTPEIVLPNRTLPSRTLVTNLLKGDKRKDVIVVFRTIRREEGGTITLLWRELQKKDSPKIELTKEQQASISPVKTAIMK